MAKYLRRLFLSMIALDVIFLFLFFSFFSCFLPFFFSSEIRSNACGIHRQEHPYTNSNIEAVASTPFLLSQPCHACRLQPNEGLNKPTTHPPHRAFAYLNDTSQKNHSATSCFLLRTRGVGGLCLHRPRETGYDCRPAANDDSGVCALYAQSNGRPRMLSPSSLYYFFFEQRLYKKSWILELFLWSHNSGRVARICSRV